MSRRSALAPEPRAFPFKYEVQEDLQIKADPRFAGFVVVVPAGLNADQQMDFRIDLHVARQVGSVTFRPKGRGMMVLDLPDDFELTPGALDEVVAQTWKDGGGRPPPPGKVTGHS
jgi:hypothetical protein